MTKSPQFVITPIVNKTKISSDSSITSFADKSVNGAKFSAIIYPNPLVRNILNIELEGNDKEISLVLYSQVGEIIYTKNVSDGTK